MQTQIEIRHSKFIEQMTKEMLNMFNELMIQCNNLAYQHSIYITPHIHETIKKENKNKKQSKKNKKLHKLTFSKIPISSFMLFMEDQQSKIQLKYPQCDRSTFVKVASQCWKTLSENERQPYRNKFMGIKKMYALKVKEHAKSRAAKKGIIEIDQ